MRPGTRGTWLYTHRLGVGGYKWVEGYAIGKSIDIFVGGCVRSQVVPESCPMGRIGRDVL